MLKLGSSFLSERSLIYTRYTIVGQQAGQPSAGPTGLLVVVVLLLLHTTILPSGTVALKL